VLFSFTDQFPGAPIDEMKPGAGVALHGFIAGRRIARLGFIQPMLHVHPGPGTFEDQITHTAEILKEIRLDELI
jgi:hypothetical protein